MNSARRATIFLLSTTVIWGSTFPITKELVQDLTALGMTASAATLLGMTARFLFASLAFVAVPGALKLGRRELWGSFMITWPGFIGLAFQGLGLFEGSSTVVAFLTNLMVVFTPIFGFFLFKEKLSKGLLVGVLLALVGIWILTNPLKQGSFGRPEWLALASAVIFGLQIQLVNAYTKDANAEAMTMGMFLHFTWMNAAALLVLPAGRAALPLALHPTAAILGWVLYLALVASALSMWVFMRFQRAISPSRAAVIYCLEPAFAALFAIGFQHDPLTWRVFVGGGLILGANLGVELLKRPASDPPAAPPAS